jgi:predicted nucleic acid-binding protein
MRAVMDTNVLVAACVQVLRPAAFLELLRMAV